MDLLVGTRPSDTDFLRPRFGIGSLAFGRASHSADTDRRAPDTFRSTERPSSPRSRPRGRFESRCRHLLACTACSRKHRPGCAKRAFRSGPPLSPRTLPSRDCRRTRLVRDPQREPDRTVTLLPQRPEYYPREIWDDGAPAWYLCRFAVARKLAGRSIGVRLLDQLAIDAERSGVAALRLDVVSSNPFLERYYLEHGFRSRGIAEILGQRVLLLERRTRPWLTRLHS
nr:MAG: hypothetical protein DIU78_26375 [Pseudomonadota bacterium]